MWAGAAPEPSGSRDNARRFYLTRSAKKTAGNPLFSFPSSSVLSLTPKQFGDPLVPPPPSPPPPPFHASGNDTILEIIHLLDQVPQPSVDGPPSTESIRALNQDLLSRQRGEPLAVQERYRSGHNTWSSSSGSASASLRSFSSSVSDHPSREHTMEAASSLSRCPSQRSSNSITPPRERPESVQLFGKIFNRRGYKLRKDGGSSTTTSSYSSSSGGSFAELFGGAESTSHYQPPSKNHPSSSPAGTIFSRRRVARETADALSRRLQISEPYNFQHVLQLQKESLPDFRERSLTALGDEVAPLRTPRIPNTHFAGFSSEALPLPGTGTQSAHAPMVPPRSSLRPLGGSPGRRTLKHSQSQEHIRSTRSSVTPPPRPPRSPPSAHFFNGPPIPPPRTSSRMSTRRDFLDSAEKPLPERPQTSSSWRRRHSFYLSDTPTPPASSHGYVPSPDMNVIPESTLSTAATDETFTNWPLPCPSPVPAALAEEPTLPALPALEQTSKLPLFPGLVSDESNKISLSRPTSPVERPPTPPPKDDELPFPKLPAQELNLEQDQKVVSPPRRISMVSLVEPVPREQVRGEASLPDLPEDQEDDDDEEEEDGDFWTGHRASVISNPSLRGSISVPVLRPLSMRQEKKGRVSRYRWSGASDTLGRLDMLAVQRALRASHDEPFSTPIEESPCGNWEDDIDYCYDHAAEASCNYAWDRLSLDLARDEDEDEEKDDEQEPPFPDEEVTATLNLQRLRTRTPSNDSTRMATPVQPHYDMPALSPASSQVSSHAPHEAATPTAFVLPQHVRSPKSPNNYSLPRLDGFMGRRQPQQQQQKQQQQNKQQHACNASEETSFDESQGFQLSPSLLIPSDFRQQIMANEADFMAAAAHDDAYLWEGQTLVSRGRTSTSTMSSNPGSHAGSERARSTASMSTDITRLTMSGFSSTSSLGSHPIEMDHNNSNNSNNSNNGSSSSNTGGVLKAGEPSAVVLPALAPSDRAPSLYSELPRAESLSTMPTLPETEEPPMPTADEHLPSGLGVRGRSEPELARLNGDEPQVGSLPRSRKDLAAPRPPHARTASLGRAPPPQGLYAFFPRDSMVLTRARF